MLKTIITIALSILIVVIMAAMFQQQTLFSHNRTFHENFCLKNGYTDTEYGRSSYFADDERFCYRTVNGITEVRHYNCETEEIRLYLPVLSHFNITNCYFVGER